MQAAIPAVIKPDPPQEVVQKINPVQITLVCFICKHRNPIQSALRRFKGTISVTHWIIFFNVGNSVTGLVSGFVYVKTHVHTPEYFLLDS